MDLLSDNRNNGFLILGTETISYCQKATTMFEHIGSSMINVKDKSFESDSKASIV